MPRELPTYRLHIEQLNLRFPEKDMLTRLDIIETTGMGITAVRNSFPFRGKFVTKVKFAHMLAQRDNY